MEFNTLPSEPVFRKVERSWIVVPQQSFPYNDTLTTQTHDLGSNTIFRIGSCAIPPQN